MKKRTPVFLAIILIVIILSLVLGYIAVKDKNNAPAKQPQTSESDTAPSESDTATQAQSKEKQVVVTTMNPEKWYLTYVSRYHKLPDDFKVEISPTAQTDYVELDTRVLPYWNNMYDAALKDGCTLTPFSGHRRISTQKTNYENKVDYYLKQGYSEDEAQSVAASIILPPGTSEHNLGLAMDIVNTEESFENTPEFAWLMENAADYGFILRYPKDKQEITNIIYEPWHWRFVGVDAAKAIKASGKCLEEYLNIK